MRHIDLCSGIGGFALAAERADVRTVAFCEADDYCRRVLARHWPHVPIFPDLRTLRGHELPAGDIVSAGWPCQPVSQAGKREGEADARWLWPDVARLLGEIRPRWVLLENVPALLSPVRGGPAPFGRVLGDLAALGFDAEWELLSACAFGAAHTRERLFLVAYPAGVGCGGRRIFTAGATALEPAGCGAAPGRTGAAEPRPGGVAYGVPNRTHRLRGTGNSIYPAVAEWIFRRIRAAEERVTA